MAKTGKAAGFIPCLVLVWALSGCAKKPSRMGPEAAAPESPAAGPGRRLPAADSLELLRESLDTRRDTLVLDLLAGYQNLLRHARQEGPLQAGIMARAEMAARALEGSLRARALPAPTEEDTARPEVPPGSLPPVPEAQTELRAPDTLLDARSRRLADSLGWEAASEALYREGEYLAARRVLARMHATDADAQEKLERIGGRYCEEKRRQASRSFIAFRKAAERERRRTLLQSALGDLDSCLRHFPSLPFSEKIRANREMVQRELDGLENSGSE